jgi:hypothetical protein
MNSTESRLMRALPRRINTNDSTPLMLVSIAGFNNQMAAGVVAHSFSINSATPDTFRIYNIFQLAPTTGQLAERCPVERQTEFAEPLGPTCSGERRRWGQMWCG